MKFFSKLLFVFVFTLAILTPTNLQAQEDFDYTKAYKDYVFTQDVYQKSHGEYLLARSQYLNAQTLASQTKAETSTIDMLVARDDVIVTHLTALRMRLLETQGISTTEKENLFSRLDNEVSWFQTHKEGISSAPSLDDLVDDSDEAADHYLLVTPLIYEVLGTIPVGRTEALRAEVNQILAQTKSKVASIRANGDHDTTNSERWIIETENKITRSLDKQIEAQRIIFALQALKERDLAKKDLSKDYNQVVSLLQESNQLLRESASYLREIVKQIKTKS